MSETKPKDHLPSYKNHTPASRRGDQTVTNRNLPWVPKSEEKVLYGEGFHVVGEVNLRPVRKSTRAQINAASEPFDDLVKRTLESDQQKLQKDVMASTYTPPDKLRTGMKK